MRILTLLFAPALLLLVSAARADSLVLDSAINGTYSYGLVLGPYENAHFPNTTGITLTGVSGVTGVNLSFAASCFTSAISSTSVTLTQSTVPFACSFLNPSPNPVEFENLFSLNSNVLTTGAISYALTGLPMASGTVGGPVSSTVTPEPSSIALLSTGLLLASGELKRRIASR